MKKGLFVLVLTFFSYGYSQATNGMSGLIHIPSARMLDDGQLVLGAAYIPKPYFQRYGRNENPGLNTYLTYGILPFVEIMFRYTHELNMPINLDTEYFPDRMLGIRIRVLEEGKNLPAFVLGLQDASAIIGDTCIDCTNYSATYLVGTKSFQSGLGRFDLSLGYSFDFSKLKAKDFKGLFGGFVFSPKFNRNFSMIFENNSRVFNTGLKIDIINRLHVMIGLWDLKKTTYSVNYTF